MKASQLAVIITILSLSTAAALKCNHCVPSTVGGRCTNTVENCSRPDDVCAAVVCTEPRYSHFKRCMKRVDAFSMDSLDFCNAFTCTTDKCN